MKIENLQSLLLSWLRNDMECQVEQTNWKPSAKWRLKHEDVLEQIIVNSSNVFKTKYGYNLHLGNSNIQQVLSQAEVDLIGISFDENNDHIYAIDASFNDVKLSDGTKEETIFRVIKKCIIMAMCMHGYFGFDNGTIIFTSPKINHSVIDDINARVDDIVSVLNNLGLNYKIRIVADEKFTDKVLEPVISGMDEFKGMKIGEIVRKVLLKMLEEGKVSEEETELMQTKGYSKETFDIQYPLLQKASITDGVSPKRYYTSPINIYGERYFLCSEWYEVPANNDRPHLLKWFALHKE